MCVAVFCNRLPANQLHNEIGPPFGRFARIEDSCDVGMVHQCQGLSLDLKARDDLLGIHSRLDDLERYATSDGFVLLGHVDNAESALADLLEELVVSDTRTLSI